MNKLFEITDKILAFDDVVRDYQKQLHDVNHDPIKLRSLEYKCECRACEIKKMIESHVGKSVKIDASKMKKINAFVQQHEEWIDSWN